MKTHQTKFVGNPLDLLSHAASTVPQPPFFSSPIIPNRVICRPDFVAPARMEAIALKSPPTSPYVLVPVPTYTFQHTLSPQIGLISPVVCPPPSSPMMEPRSASFIAMPGETKFQVESRHFVHHRQRPPIRKVPRKKNTGSKYKIRYSCFRMTRKAATRFLLESNAQSYNDTIMEKSPVQPTLPRST